MSYAANELSVRPARRWKWPTARKAGIGFRRRRGGRGAGAGRCGCEQNCVTVEGYVRIGE